MAILEQQVTSAFEQARLLSMYIPSALRILLGRAHPTDLWRNASSLQEEGAGTFAFRQVESLGGRITVNIEGRDGW